VSERVKERVNDVAESFDSFEVPLLHFCIILHFGAFTIFRFLMQWMKATLKMKVGNRKCEGRERKDEKEKRRKGGKRETEKLRNCTSDHTTSIALKKPKTAFCTICKVILYP